MSSTAYHWSPRLVESGDGVETVDPWLDDKTTIPYRRGAARSSNQAESTPLPRGTQPEAAPAQPSNAEPPQRSATLPPRPELKAQRAPSSTAPMPAAPSLRPYFSPPAVVSANVIPLQRTAAAGSVQQRARPNASARHVTTMKIARPAQPRKRQPVTMKIDRLQTRPALTPDQASNYALESYWRTQESAVRARNARWLWIGAAIGAAVVVAAMLRLLGPKLFPSLPWQRAPRVSLADLMTSEHSQRTHSAAAASGIQPTNVMVTAPESGALAQPATLRVDSQPWARVIVDDVLIGNTPQLAIPLQPGKHTLRLHNPERSLMKDIPLEAHPGETIHRTEQLDR